MIIQEAQQQCLHKPIVIVELFDDCLSLLDTTTIGSAIYIVLWWYCVAYLATVSLASLHSGWFKSK